MIDVAQATASTSDPWTMYLTIGTILFLIIQTVIIGFQTRIFSRQTKILEEQARLNESVELSIKLVHQDPLTRAGNQLRLIVTNEGKGLAMTPVVNFYSVNYNSQTVASGSCYMQSIGPGKHEEVMINMTGSAITPNMRVNCYWAATGINGRTSHGSHELIIQ
jgi:hypothetical protein